MQAQSELNMYIGSETLIFENERDMPFFFFVEVVSFF